MPCHPLGMEASGPQFSDLAIPDRAQGKTRDRQSETKRPVERCGGASGGSGRDWTWPDRSALAPAVSELTLEMTTAPLAAIGGFGMRAGFRGLLLGRAPFRGFGFDRPDPIGREGRSRLGKRRDRFKTTGPQCDRHGTPPRAARENPMRRSSDAPVPGIKWAGQALLSSGPFPTTSRAPMTLEPGAKPFRNQFASPKRRKRSSMVPKALTSVYPEGPVSARDYDRGACVAALIMVKRQDNQARNHHPILQARHQSRGANRRMRNH